MLRLIHNKNVKLHYNPNALFHVQLSHSYVYRYLLSWSEIHQPRSFLKTCFSYLMKKFHMEKDPITTDKIKRKVQFSEVIETFTTYNDEVGKSS